MVSLLDLGWEVGQGVGVMRRMMIWLLLIAGLLPRLGAGEHWMHGRAGDPLAVPVWDEFFAEGPFRRPEGVERAVGENCREGWAAVFRLDDGAAERWFRAALEGDPENVEAMVGLAAANSGMPGRAAAAARQALAVMPEGAPGLMRELAAAWFGAAARLASAALTKDPGDGRAMRGLHEALCGRAWVLASAGAVDEAMAAAREAGEDCVLETAVRLEKWGVVRETSGRALAALPGPSLERIRWLHAETLGAARERDLLRMFPKLAAMRGAYEQMRVTPELADAAGLEAAANLIRETEGWIAVIQGQPVPVWPAVDVLVPAVRLVALMKAAGRESEIPAAFKEVVPAGVPEWRAAAAWMASVPDGLVARWSRGEGDGELMPDGKMGPMWSPVGAPGLPGMETAGPRVVIFFLGYRCDHCLKQLDIFRLWEARIRAAGASLVAVSVDNEERVARTWAGPDRTKEEPYPFPILADPELGRFKEWGAWDGFGGRPVHGTFVTDGAGKVRWQRMGTEPFYDAGAVVALLEALRVEKGGEAGK